jgi:hypothetical protein
MRRVLLFLVLAACGTSTTGDDAGNTPDSGGNDATQSNDVTQQQDVALPTDATNDAISTGDGSVGPGQPCDPQNNQCKAGLLCCSEPTHIPDSSTAYFCEPPDQQQQCPKLP